MIRTGEHPDMKFNQFLLAPYIGCGSPVEQTMWIDDLTVATCRPDTNSVDDSYIPNSNTQFVLFQNYPNPFNPYTIIKFTTIERNPAFDVNTDENTKIVIYNIKGQKVKTLADNNFEKGNHSITWYGEDDKGKSVSSGIYFYQLKVNGKTEAVKKCLLLK